MTGPAFADSITIADLEADPFPIYARLRREAPIAPIPVANCWFATRWDDIMAIARSADFTAESPDAPVNEAFGAPNILTCDGPVHRSLRHAIEPAYSPRAVAHHIDTLIRPLAAAQFDAFLSGDSDDLVAGFFEPLSSLALARSLGLETVDAEVLRSWFHGLSLGAINFERDPEKQAANDAVCAQIEEIVLPLLASLKDRSDQRPFARFLFSGLDVGRRPVEQILPTLKVTLLGGMQEPGHGAATVLHGLLQNPDQLRAVQADRSLLPKAIDEGLRWIAPIGTSMRTAIRDTRVGDTPIPAGTPVSCILASANRDESRYDEPDRFDMNRPKAATMSFGTGAHMCVGKWFARAQIEIALNLLFDHFPDIRLVEEPQFWGWEFRALTAMRIVR